MAKTVREIMDTDVPTVTIADSVETVLEVLRDHELPGVPVINEGGRCVGIITEEDLILSGENEDLHLPHYFELFGGFVFLEPLSHFEDRLRKATAALARDLMTEDPVTIEPHEPVADAARGGRRGRRPPRSARSSRPTATATAPWPRRAPRSRAARAGSPSPPRPRPRRCARRASAVRCWSWARSRP